MMGRLPGTDFPCGAASGTAIAFFDDSRPWASSPSARDPMAVVARKSRREKLIRFLRTFPIRIGNLTPCTSVQRDPAKTVRIEALLLKRISVHVLSIPLPEAG